MSGFLRELRAAREARIERRARSRVTSALDAAVDAASTLRLADTEADDGSARTTSTASGPSVDDFPPDLLPSSVRRRRRNGDLLSDDALRRIVDRIHAQHVEEQDANARLQAAIRGLTSEEFAALPDDTWPRVKPDDAKPTVRPYERYTGRVRGVLRRVRGRRRAQGAPVRTRAVPPRLHQDLAGAVAHVPAVQVRVQTAAGEPTQADTGRHRRTEPPRHPSAGTSTAAREWTVRAQNPRCPPTR